MRDDFFLRLPQPMALLLLSSLLNFTFAHNIYQLPRRTLAASQPVATKTLSHHAIDVVPYPPAPTSPPRFGADLRRQETFNTVCGYIGGDPNLAATCGPGSHCVLDTQHGAVGCCPDSEPLCTTGVFTGCIDGNSAPQTAIDPYVFTCQGGNVCYRNQYDGGFFQYGCGTASDMGTSVLASASGITANLDRPTVTFSFTDTPVSLASPTALLPVTVPTMAPQGTTEEPSTMSSEAESSSAPISNSDSTLGVISTTTSSSRSTGSSSSVSSTLSTVTSTSPSSSLSSTQSTTSTPSTSSSSSLSITSPTSNILTSSTSAPVANDPHSRNHTGALVGGTIGGLAALVALIALGFWLWRRRMKKAANARTAPPSDSTEYISPMRRSHDQGPAFAPLHSNDQDGWETGPAPSNLMSVGWGAQGARPGQIGRAYGYPPTADTAYPAPHQYPGPYGAAAAPAVPRRPTLGLYEEPELGDHDQIPLNAEIDDFSRGFHDALDRIGEEDEASSSFYGSRTNVNEGNGVNGGNHEDPGPYGGVRPLWQQQRRQSRNLMWM